jgi:hypothetical protein
VTIISQDNTCENQIRNKLNHVIILIAPFPKILVMRNLQTTIFLNVQISDIMVIPSHGVIVQRLPHYE